MGHRLRKRTQALNTRCNLVRLRRVNIRKYGSGKTAFLCQFGPLIDGRQAQRRSPVHSNLDYWLELGDAKTLSAVVPDACALSRAAAILSPFMIRMSRSMLRSINPRRKASRSVCWLRGGRPDGLKLLL
jgi:hypothetical protein